MKALSPTFRALQREALLTKQMLGAGATYIYKANYALHGMYFQAFTSLSVGLERIGKLCVMLDHVVDNGGAFPSDAHMRTVGHDLVGLYKRSQTIKLSRKFNFRSLQDLSDPTRYSILEILSSFAKGDRYANINLLSGKAVSRDSMAAWASVVDEKLYQDKVTAKKKALIQTQVQQCASMDRHTFVFHAAEDGSPILTYGDGLLRELKRKAVAPYRQLLVLQIIRYWVDLLLELEAIARTVLPSDIPVFSEILGPLANDDAYIRTRRTWDER